SLLLFFFFSSRRRHTRFSRDWSSDVCSSDLPVAARLVQDESLVSFHRATAHDMLPVKNEVSQPGGGVDIQLSQQLSHAQAGGLRSEERRVGKEWRARWVR